MRSSVLVSLLALAIALPVAPSLAAGAGPVVIPGIGPEQAPAYAMQPVAAQPRYASSSRQQSNLGGGFLELLLTGRDPSPAELPAPDSAYPRGTRPQPGLTAAPRIQAPAAAPRVETAAFGAQTAPAATPRLSVQRGLDPAFVRQEVDYDSKYPAGTIIVHTPSRYLYLVLGNGRALRYGIGVGRPGFEWAGEKRVTRKAEWPDWTPPPEMLKRRPDLPRHMAGGPENPLGARALYLGSSLYRIHGTNEPYTIGHNVSSGCIRMMNEDVIDLYDKVPVGARVIVM